METYAKNGNKKVVIVAHSLGNLYTTYLLSKQSQSWKDKYISSYINMAGPLGGAAKIMRLMASGSFAFLIQHYPQIETSKADVWKMEFILIEYFQYIS